MIAPLLIAGAAYATRRHLRGKRKARRAWARRNRPCCAPCGRGERCESEGGAPGATKRVTSPHKPAPWDTRTSVWGD